MNKLIQQHKTALVFKSLKQREKLKNISKHSTLNMHFKYT